MPVVALATAAALSLASPTLAAEPDSDSETESETEPDPESETDPEPAPPDPDDPNAILELPSVAAWVDAPFPASAQDAGITEARVVLRVSTDASGLVLDASILSEDPPEHGFGEAALTAVLDMRFNPARTAAGPIPATFEFAYGFQVTEVVEDVTPVAAENLAGIVRELGTREPIGEALVDLVWAGEGESPGRFQGLTDADGRFAFSAVPAGTWRIVVKGPIHYQQTETVEIADGEATDVTLWVRPDNTSSNEITVFGERERPPEITRRTLTTQEIRRVPGTFGDPVKVIQTLPGAARSPFGTGLLIIRGANPEDTGVYVDGIRIPLIYHLTGTTSVIAPDLVDSVDYLPGGYAGRFGRTLAGTVDVRTRQHIDETRISAGADVLDAQAYLQTNVPVSKDGEKKLGIAIGGRRSYIDAFLPYFLADSAFAIKPRYYDYQLKLIAPTPEHRRLSLFIYGFDDVLSVTSARAGAFSSDADAQGDVLTQYNSHRAILNYEEDISDQLTLKVTPSVGADRTMASLGGAFSIDGKTTIFQTRAELAWEPSDAITVTPGLDLLAGPWGFTFRAPLQLDDIDDPIGEREPIGLEDSGWVTYPDAWLRLDLRPLNDRDRLLLVPSFRVNNLIFAYTGELNSDAKAFTGTSFDPRISGRFELIDGLAVKGSTGLYHQPPQPQESIGVGATPDLGYERAWNTSFGVEHEVSPAIQWELELFWRDMSRLIDISSDFTGAGSQPFANVGYGRAYGLELIARHQPTGRFFGWVSYTLSRSERRASKEADWVAFDFDQTHILSAQAGYDLPRDFGVSFQVQYVTGNPDTPFNAGIYDVDNDEYNGFRIGGSNSQRLPAFFQTSLRFDKTFLFKSWELETYVDLLNIVRGVNPEITLYNYDYSQYAYVRGLPFIPNLGIEARIRR